MKKVAVPITIIVAIEIFFLISCRKQAPEVLPPKKEVPLVEEGKKLEAPKESKLPTGQVVPTLSEIKTKSQVIKTEVEGEIIYYFKKSFYSADDFSVILENENEFKSELIKKFKKEIIGVTAENCKVDLDESKKSAILKCDINGAMYGTNSYNMHFLLGNWLFDLYQFKKYEKKLVYDREINGVPTKVVFEFPYALSHCHEHVWPR